MKNMEIIQGHADVDNGLNPVSPTIIKVVGCGGCGGNAVNTMIDANVMGVQFIAMNTDLQDLRKSKAEFKLQIGQKSAKGLGAGGKPEVGEEAAKEEENAIRELLNGSDMIFITAGMGGGTGTGAAPVVAKVAKEIGALTVAVVTTPFEFEGRTRTLNAEEGVRNLRNTVDSLIVIPNEQIYKDMEDEDITIDDAYVIINDILRQGVQAISDNITQTGLVNRDFRDVQTVMKGQGDAILGIGIAEGANRAINAAEKAINNKLLENTHIDGAKNILVNITGGKNKVKMTEPREIINLIRKRADVDANILWGQYVDETLEDKIRVTVIATGFDSAKTPHNESPIEYQAQELQHIHDDPNLMSEGDFVSITKTPSEVQREAAQPQASVPPVQKTVQNPEPTVRQTPKQDLFSDMFSGAIYEEDDNAKIPPLGRTSKPAAQVQPERPAFAKQEPVKPASDFSGRNEDDIPAAMRNIDPITGLPRKMSFGKNR